MDIAYAAHTSSCIFMLDEDGICRWVVTRGAAVSRATVDHAQRCIGAQYVASLDMDSERGLIDRPKVGSRLLFAVVDKGGRITLVRSGTLTRFEDRRADALRQMSTPTLPYERAELGVERASGSGARRAPSPDPSQPIEIELEADALQEVDELDEAAPETRTRVWNSRRAPDSHRAPYAFSRAVGAPETGADADRCDTDPYLPLQARALKHLARLKR